MQFLLHAPAQNIVHEGCPEKNITFESKKKSLYLSQEGKKYIFLAGMWSFTTFER